MDWQGVREMVICKWSAVLLVCCAAVLLVGCAETAGSSSSSTTSLIPAGSTWKYLDNGSDQGTAWRQPSFDDSSWPSGAAPLGNVPEGDRRVIATTITSGPFGAHIITYYFRKSFDVPNPSAFADLTLQLRRDDGAIIYLNGVEIVRSNMPSGPVDYRTPIPERVLDQGLTWWEFRVSNRLAVGRNVIAVELHEYDYTTDSLFDLQLGASGSGGSSTSLIAPSPTF
jgi:hypothetical protein